MVALLIAACQPWASAMRTVVVRARPASAMVVMRSGKPTNVRAALRGARDRRAVGRRGR